ncbi:UTP--glucose-1-phosphate uridylyltransferase [Sulfitobacter sp. D35]|uniref:UTP--glucose-1-phosphate uridylyltransferase n=1 Tax=Sulfitobacter sp. D35 TaxID=3083252 RepID=UPI00296FBDAD|nr:UTP--glucose-1-phosphate uridylyltransferase [Sulfitobacter sp. D35]MDW4498531.1 UTP--glucose-1-phosphate uridylyltransferase [Sulfitobacter sp. D35]
MSHVKIAVFPVAGLGTRFLPATKSIPKEMLPVVDRPLIEYAVEEARAAGIEEFVFVTSASKRAIEDHFGAAPELERQLRTARKTAALDAVSRSRLPEGSSTFLRQDNPRGLGHAVSLAARLVGDRPFAVLLPDDVIDAPGGCLRQMVAAHAETGGHMVATMTVDREATRAYGVLDVTERAGRIFHARGLVEKPAPEAAPSREAVVGRYILDPAIFRRLATLRPGAGGEIQLTDAISADCENLPVSGFGFDGARYDCGSVAGYLEANLAFALSRPELTGGTLDMMARHLARHQTRGAA